MRRLALSASTLFCCAVLALLCFGIPVYAAPANPAGVTLTLALPGGKTVFHRGEIIPLSAAFTSSTPGVYDLNTDPGNRSRIWSSDTFQCDSPAATDPLRVFYDHEFGQAFEGAGPRFEPLTAKPIGVPFTLNEWLRFETPGRYRVSLTTYRLVDAAKRHEEFFFKGHAVTSNSVEFTVLPNDPAWDAQTLQTALPLYNKVATDYSTQGASSDAVDVIRFLGTPDAGRAMIARYGTFTEYEADNSPAYFETELGLYGFPDRPFIMNEMHRKLAAPDFPVSAFFLNDLTETQFLDAYPDVVPPYDPNKPARNTQRDTLTTQRLAALTALSAQARADLEAAIPLKTGRAKAISVLALLRTDRHRNSPAQRDLARALVPVFDDLTPEQQGYLLDENGYWPEIRDPRLVPLLRRLYAEPLSAADSGGLEYSNAQQRRSVVLRHLVELSPAEGRSLLLAEIKNPKTQVDLPTLCSLPDKTLPMLDTVLAVNLENSLQQKGGDSDIESKLVERYATAAILPRLKAEYRFFGCAVEVNLLAYFLRTDPAYGAAQLKRALVPRTGYGCSRYVLGNVAALQYGPEVERLAVLHLHDPDTQTAADAAKTLGNYGSPAAEPLLWARMREWHREWAGKDVQAAPNQGELEYVLTFALAGSPRWLLNAPQLETLAALCVTPGAKQNMEALAQHWTDPIVITYGGERDDWMLVQYMSLSSLRALEAKLAQFPTGTRFVLSRTNFADAAAQSAVYQRLAPFVEKRGMRLTAQPFPMR